MEYWSLVTNDFNLTKVANLQGVRVLNVNQLANSLRPVILPGEKMKIKVWIFVKTGGFPQLWRDFFAVDNFHHSDKKFNNES